jgi:hypothetical protein
MREEGNGIQPEKGTAVDVHDYLQVQPDVDKTYFSSLVANWADPDPNVETYVIVPVHVVQQRGAQLFA